MELITADGRPLSILIVALNGAPEPVGCGRATGALAEGLAARGHRVEVVTAPPHYPHWRVAAGYRAARYAVAHTAGVRTLRCPLYVPRRPTAGGRLLHQLSFALTSAPAALWRAFALKPDVVLTVAPALMAAPGAWLTARATGATAWLHVQDLEVDMAFQLGVLAGTRRRRLAHWIERRILRAFDRVTAIQPEIAHHLADKGVAPDRLGVFANWVDCTEIRPLEPGAAPRAAFGLPDDSFIALYAGTLADKQGLDALVGAAARLTHRRDLHIAIVGDGPAKPDLQQAAAELPNLSLAGLVPAERLNALLGCADAHLLPQAAGVGSFVLPSKLNAMLASGRPVIAAAPADSQLAALVANCGLCLPANDPEAFAEAIARLADDPVLARGLARSARERAVESLDAGRILGRLERALQAARPARPRTGVRAGDQPSDGVPHG
jgi:colanic acid biosynthesis glycosyl transferase WcaI